MPSDKLVTGMRGVYLVAAELSRLGYIVSPTSRGAQGADLLVTDSTCQRVYTVQVKTDTRNPFWLIGKRVKSTVSKSHIFVLVRIRALKDGESVEYYVVPSRKVSELGYLKGNFPNIKRKDIERYKNKWKIFSN